MNCSTVQNIPESENQGDQFIIPILTWIRLIRDLRCRGEGRRESGAFLLGCRGRRSKVRGYALYDDLDPTALDTGMIVIHASGFRSLWKRCRSLKLDVVADVHTHPNDITRQSEIDRQNPLIPRVGHIAIILPRFASTPLWRLRSVSFNEYLGNYQWRTWSPRERSRRLRLSLW
jgi:proteasome lid subunit RPN8/RPN11